MRSSALRVYEPEVNTSRQTERSGRPTQPGNRSTASQPIRRKRKRKTILHRLVYFCKSLNWKGRLVLAVLALAFILPIALVLTSGREAPEDTGAADVPPVATTTEAPDPVPEYIFRDGTEGTPVNWQALTAAWAAEAGFEKHYDLTDAERWEIASVITAEAEGEPFAGKVAVAQCILQACEDDGIRPFEALSIYGYSRWRPEPCEEALEAVQAVFDFGQVASTEPIKYFYAPARVVSDWHESQVYVMTINGHKFFKEATE